jgi:PleD family two-component response regulator
VRGVGRIGEEYNDRVRIEEVVRQGETWAATTSPPTTFCAGIALQRPNEDVSRALDRADRALYAAKRAGRNRTEMAAAPVS